MEKHTRHNSTDIAGFTLLELLIVIAIMGIIVAFSLPDITEWLVSQKIHAASQSLQKSLEWAEGYAIRSGNPVTVTVSPSATGCSWVVSPVTSTVLENVPSVQEDIYQGKYPNTTCAVSSGVSSFSIYPTGLVVNSLGQIVDSDITFSVLGNNPGKYGFWLIQMSGAGGLRDCAQLAFL